MSTWVVVVAAGSGSRFGGPKQFADLAGRRVIDWSIATASEVADGVVVVMNESDVDAVGPTLNVARVVPGGTTRSASTNAGLSAVPAEADIVLVHDAARPLATRKLYESVISAVKHGGADAAVPGVAIPDTVKRVSAQPSADSAVLISGTLDRNEIVAVQTPQAFKAAALRKAYEDEPEATDDAAAVERMGGRAVVVAGEPANIKITLQHDLKVLSALVSQ